MDKRNNVNLFNEREFREICDRFNSEGWIEDIDIDFSRSSFFNKMKASIRKDRRGEVVFCVLRPNGKVIAITCTEYPQDIYRIPTGGIHHQEDISRAMFREVKEELGLEVAVREFAGVVRIRFMHGADIAMFYSYVFILEEKGGRLLLDASDDEISGVMEVTVDELGEMTDALAGIRGKWQDWGKFRYTTSNAVYRHLKNKI